MSFLGALGGWKGLKRGVLYVFCSLLSAAPWSSQFSPPPWTGLLVPLGGFCFSFLSSGFS